jgi:hypothetical protein
LSIVFVPVAATRVERGTDPDPPVGILVVAMIPFIVEVNTPVLKAKALLFMIFTPVPATPLTVVVSVLVLDVLDTVFMEVVVEVIPFTFEVITLLAEDNVFPEITLVVAVTPLTVLVSTLPATP